MEPAEGDRGKRIGDLFVESGVVTREQVERVIAEHEGAKKRVGELLMDSGLINEDVFAHTLARQLELPFTDLQTVKPQKNALNLFPKHLAVKHQCLPLTVEQGMLTVAMTDPLDLVALDDLQLSSEMEISPTVAIKSHLLDAIEHYYPTATPIIGDVEELEASVRRTIASIEDAGQKTRTFSIISNKGGVGKTHVAINLAYCIAKRGREVLLIDGDLGNADIGIKVGVFPKYNLLDFFNKQRDIEEIISGTVFGFKLMGGVSGEFRLANLVYAQKLRFITNFHRVSQLFDVVIFDLGAGIHRNVLDFALAADETLIITTPQDIVSGYACVKASFYRFKDLETRLAEQAVDYSPETKFRPRVILNQLADTEQGQREFDKILAAAQKHIAETGKEYHLDIDYLGGILYDKEHFRQAERMHKPFIALFPNRQTSQCIYQVAASLLGTGKGVSQEPSFKTRFKRFANIVGERL
jgi:flagellar biosynthesis protein FlhG